MGFHESFNGGDTMKVFHTLENIDIEPNGIFLAGPTHRSWAPNKLRWRQQAIKLFSEYGFKGNLFVPEFRNTENADIPIHNSKIYEWEHFAMSVADVILFWIPRSEELPGFTTNVEFGYCMGHGLKKVVYGRPDNTPHTDYLDWMFANELMGYPRSNLEDVVRRAIHYAIL